MSKKQIIRRYLLSMAETLESWGKLFRGAADKVESSQRLTLGDCERENWRNVRPPCFVLSTGRVGTLLLNRLLLLSGDAYAHHEPKPELYRASRRAYEEIHQSPEIFREVFKSAREEYVLKAAQQAKTYIETNNQITFFAPVICDVFPTAVFIHLVRHPGDFVRSGIRRKWYAGKHSHDVGRIVPVKGKFKDRWDTLSQIEKIGWLWNETNEFIEGFKQTIPEERMLFVKAEDLFSSPAVAEEIFKFLKLGGYIKKKVIRVIKKPINVQKKSSFPHHSEWSEADRKSLEFMTPMADKYNFKF